MAGCRSQRSGPRWTIAKSAAPSRLDGFSCPLGALQPREEAHMKKKTLSRRRFVATSAAASASMIAAPFVRTARAAGKLSIGFWDHWVPGANDTSRALVEEWAAKEKVDVQIDYITSQGNKLLLTIAAEAQARSGHDILATVTWLPQANANNLEPVDDIMEPLIK